MSPYVPSGSTYDDCLRILKENNVLDDAPGNVISHLRAGAVVITFLQYRLEQHRR